MRDVKIYYRFYLSLLIFAGAISCAQKPTKIYESRSVNLGILESGLEKPLRIDDATILLDARPQFEYAIAHAPQAINLQWSDFTDRRGPFPGLIKKNLDEAVRRLSLYGLHPKSQVVILGQGHNGSGEEGRLAWTLLYLGIEDVQIVEVNSAGLKFSNIVTPPRANAKPWSPQLRSSILADKKEVVQIASNKKNPRIHILDVRSGSEYLEKNKNKQYALPDLNAVHIEWKEFFKSNGRPNPSMVNKLNSIGVQASDRIIVISNNGVRSASVTYALLTLGFSNAANFAGGYTELMNKK